MHLIYIALSIFMTFTLCKSSDYHLEQKNQNTSFFAKNEVLQSDKYYKLSDSIIVLDTIIMCVQGLYETEFVIRNQVEYEKLLEIRSPHPDCKNYTLPPINFEKYILIVIRRSSAGLGITFEKQVLFKKNTFIINYQIIQHGPEERSNHIREYFLIEKIDSKNLVEFNYTKKYLED